MKKYYLLFVGIVALFVASCSNSEPIIDEGDDSMFTNYLFILNEGSMNNNDATLALYDLDEDVIYNDFFGLINGKGLGDTANDMIQYGSKVYVSLTHSSVVHVVDSKSGKLLKQIDMKDNGVAKDPNKLAAHEGKVYVTSYDDTVTRIDTTSLERDGSIEVGRDPEGICVSGNKLYVANSGGLEYLTGNFDSTVSVIDIASFTEIDKIEVGKNPYQVQADSKGNIIVSTRDIYDSEFQLTDQASLKRISSQTGEVKTIDGIIPNKFVVVDNIAYIVINDWSQTVVATYDSGNDKVIKENIIPTDFEMSTPYEISVDKKSGDIFLTETDYVTPGNVHCFNNNGEHKYSIEAVGINPTVVIRN